MGEWVSGWPQYVTYQIFNPFSSCLVDELIDEFLFATVWYFSTVLLLVSIVMNMISSRTKKKRFILVSCIYVRVLEYLSLIHI